MIEGLLQSHKVRQNCQNDQDMKYLMRVTPNIELSGIKSFWHTCLITEYQSQGRKSAVGENSYGVDRSTENIETAFHDQPRKADLALHILYTI